MNFSVDRDKLSQALSVISHQVLIKPALPILANILLSAEKNNLKISATNLELGVVFEIPAKVTKSGSVTLPARTLTEFVSALGAPGVNLKLEGAEVRVESGSNLAKLPTISADEYPTIPKITQVLVETDGKKLSQTLERLVFAASQDLGRPILTGVLVNFSGQTVEFVATDGYRLSFEKIKLTKNAGEASVVIPARTLYQLLRVISEGGNSVKILYDPSVNQIGFEADKTFLASRLIDGTFPDWQKIVPQAAKTRAVLGKLEFLQAVKVASVFAKETGNTVKVVFSKNLEIAAQSGVGTSTTIVPAKVTGEKLEIAFNWRYLQEALQAVPGESVEVSLVESLAPAKFTPVKSATDFFHIIMPVRT